MKIIFSHWNLYGSSPATICYYLGEGLAKLNENVTFYAKQVNKPVKYGKLKIFKTDFEKNAGNEILKDKPEFSYFPSPHILKSLKLINRKKIIQPFWGRPLKYVRKDLLNENGCLFKEKKHGAMPEQYFSLKEINAQNKFIKNSERYILCAGQDIADTWIKAGYDPKKVFNVPHGVNTKIFYPNHKSHKKFRILFTGNAAIRKGLPYLLKAFKRLNKEYKNIELIIISWWISKIDLPNVTTINKVPFNKMPEYYNKCDLSVLPSLEDAVPLTVLESMACNTPVITTKGVGYDDIIENKKDGILIKKKNVQDIYENIKFLIDNPKIRKEMGNAGRIKAEQNTWGIQAKKLQNILYKIKNGS